MIINHRFILPLVSLLGIGIALAVAPAAPQQPKPLPANQPPSRFNYHDDQDGRRLADIRLKIVERDGRPCLELTISAVGPQVEPMPGFAGVRGANRHTAEQIENILAGHFSFAVKTTAADSSPPRNGTWRAGRRGTVPERRLGPDGRIDFLAVTSREYPLELIVETGALGEGRQTTELWFDDMPRLRLTYQVAGKQVRIMAFDSLGHAHPAETPVNAEQKDGKDTTEPPQEKPLKPPVTDAEWDARDLEGKWVLYQKLIRADEKNIKAFTPYLAEHKDFDFLEMIALHQSLYQGGIAASWALAKADAPQWLRVAAWLRPVDIDHGETETQKLLVKHNPAKALAWLDKYAAEAFLSKDEKEISRFGDRSNPLLRDLKVLKKTMVKAGDLGKALPPLQPSAVFRYLDAPKTLYEFGDRKRAEADKVYVHQVLRAIKALVQSGRCREPWIGKLLQLTRHTNPEVRQAAFLAFADFGYDLDPKNSPIDDFRKVMDDAKETAAIRESALLAFSSISHPQVYVRLHELALETDHPAWPAAISRLNDLGDEFTLEHLNGLDKTKLSAKNAAILEKTRGDLKKWVEDPQRARDVSYTSVATRLERAAWAEYTKSPVQKTLTPWTKSFFVKQPDDAFVENLEKVQKEYEPTYSAADPKAMTHLVRALAMTILNTPKP